jgi:hypothetical protein
MVCPLAAQTQNVTFSQKLLGRFLLYSNHLWMQWSQIMFCRPKRSKYNGLFVYSGRLVIHQTCIILAYYMLLLLIESVCILKDLVKGLEAALSNHEKIFRLF